MQFVEVGREKPSDLKGKRSASLIEEICAAQIKTIDDAACLKALTYPLEKPIMGLREPEAKPP